MPSSSSDQFLWIGPSGGSWSTASDWDDLTSGVDPSDVVPGTGATVEIAGPASGTLSVGGSGSASLLTIVNGVTLSGGTITAQDTALTTAGAALLVYLGTTLDTGALDITAPTASVHVEGSTGFVDVTGPATIAGTFTSSNNGNALLGSNVVLTGGTLDEADSGSTITIGAQGYGINFLINTTGTLTGSGEVDVQYIDGALGISYGYLEDYGVINAQDIYLKAAIGGGEIGGSSPGVVNVLDGGTFDAAAGVEQGDQLIFNIGNSATLDLPTDLVDDNTLIDFTGALGQVIFRLVVPGDSINPTYEALDFAGSISGFAPGDRIFGVIDREGGIASEQYGGNPKGGDGLALSLYGSDGGVAAIFRINGSYSASDFLLTVLPNQADYGQFSEDFQIDFAPLSQYGLSAGNGGHTLLYVGASGGAWGNAANWQDLTTGQAATAAPGAGDTAEINGTPGILSTTVITQVGNAGTLLITGKVALNGQFTAGTVMEAAGATLVLPDNATLTTATLDISGATLFVFGNQDGTDGASLDVTASAVLSAGGVLNVNDGGVAQLATATLDTPSQLSVDDIGYTYASGAFSQITTASAITVGTLDDAAPGTVMIDPGVTLDEVGQTGTSIISIMAQVVDDGIFVQTTTASLSGNGVVIIPAGQSGGGAIASSASLAISAASGSVVTLDGNLGSGDSLALSGSDDDVSTYLYTLTPTTYVPIGGLFPATISGFTYSDVITTDYFGGVQTSYDQTTANTGTLSLIGADGVAGTEFPLSGNDSNVDFVSADTAFYSTGGQFVIADAMRPVEVGIAEPGNFGLSGGTTHGDVFDYTGPVGGAWGDAANWQDITTGEAAAVAPGAADTVALVAPANPPPGEMPLLTGQGTAAVLNIEEDAAFAGQATVGTLETTGAFLQAQIVPGGTLLATNLTFDFDGFEFDADGPGALLSVGTLSEEFGLTSTFFTPLLIQAENGATVHVGAETAAPQFIAAGSATLDLPTTVITESALNSFTNPIILNGTGDLLAFDSPTATSLSVGPAITGFADTDVVQVIFAPGVASVAFVQNGTASETATLNNAGGGSLGALSFSGNYTGHSFISQEFGDTTEITLDAACYAAGTHIRTPDGETPIERLRVGDRVVSAFGGTAPVQWLGRRRTLLRQHPRPWDVMPVRVAPDAFAPGVPARPLLLSPDHAVYLQGVLIPIRYLLNGCTIAQHRVDEIVWWHVELPRHDVILAEGLAAESYLDTGNRAAFDNGGAAIQLHPDFARDTWVAESCARLAVDGPILQAARRSLLRRLPACGFTPTDTPDLRFVVDGGLPVMSRRDGDWHRLTLPAHARTLRILSRHNAPAALDPASQDWRRLGVAMTDALMDDAALPLDHPRFGRGWQAPEQGLRWTDGDGALDVSGVTTVALRLAKTRIRHANRMPQQDVAEAA